MRVYSDSNNKNPTKKQRGGVNNMSLMRISLPATLMADDFKLRVDKVFGSLLQTLENPNPNSLSQSTPWSLSDDAVERREWNRDSNSPEREEMPCSSSFDRFGRLVRRGKSMNFRKELEEDDDDDEDDDEEGEKRDSEGGGDHGHEDWEIRSSVGLDSTLDHEEEEDAYDKVAVGRENAGERLYMGDITDHGPYLNSHNVLPDTWEEVRNAARDPRANHFSARARLKEDEATAGHVDSTQTCDDEMPVFVDTRAKVEDGGNVKSILKRKEEQNDSKSRKRVRFGPGCKGDPDEALEEPHEFSMVTQSMEATEITEAGSSEAELELGVPDYIKNPSKYTHYTFDSVGEEDDESNIHAFTDFCNTVNASTSADITGDLPESVTFTPRRKVGDAKTAMESSEKMVGPVGIAAGEAKESDAACAMEEDEPQTSGIVTVSRKPHRRYRSKVDGIQMELLDFRSRWIPLLSNSRWNSSCSRFVGKWIVLEVEELFKMGYYFAWMVWIRDVNGSGSPSFGSG